MTAASPKTSSSQSLRAEIEAFLAQPQTGRPLALYVAGDDAGAAQLAAQVLADDPNAADALLCLLLLNLRSGDAKKTAQAVRACARVRAADWVLAMVRQDISQRGPPALSAEGAMRLGAGFRSSLPSLCQPLKPEQRQADHAFVNAVGTSYVRGLGANTAIFPLFIGIGRTMLLLTEEAAALTRRKFAANLSRVDSSKPTLLVIGGDANNHVRNLLNTRTHDGHEATDADRELIRLAAQRHAGVFEEAHKHIKGRLMMLSALPTYNDHVNALGMELNAALRPICDSHDVEFVDCWEALADTATNRLRLDYSASAYPDDIHFSLAATPVFLDELKRRGVLPQDAPSSANFEWTSVFDCLVEETEPTRIWCEPSISPNNAIKSDKIASTLLSGAVADLVSFLLLNEAGRNLGVVNSRDGALAIQVPAALHSGCLSLTDTEDNRRAGQMALDFYGRSDVRHSAFTEGIAAAAGQSFFTLVLLIHPGTEDEDLQRCNEALKRLGPAQRIVVALPDRARLADLDLEGRRMVGPIEISNRLIPEKWRQFCTFVSA
jgi:hypothetical protein